MVASRLEQRGLERLADIKHAEGAIDEAARPSVLACVKGAIRQDAPLPATAKGAVAHPY